MKSLVFLVLFGAFSVSCVVVESPDPEPEPDEAPDTRLQCGAAVAPCDCYGPAGPGTRIQERACRTGVAEAVPCTTMGYCPAGGLPWFPRCTC